MVDSVKLYETLKSADLSEQQARAITEVIGSAIDSQEIHFNQSLATKADAHRLASAMERLEAKFSAIDSKFDRMEAVLSEKIVAGKMETIRWVVGIGLALAALMVSLAKLGR